MLFTVTPLGTLEGKITVFVVGAVLLIFEFVVVGVFESLLCVVVVEVDLLSTVLSEGLDALVGALLELGGLGVDCGFAFEGASLGEAGEVGFCFTGFLIGGTVGFWIGPSPGCASFGFCSIGVGSKGAGSPCCNAKHGRAVNKTTPKSRAFKKRFKFI